MNEHFEINFLSEIFSYQNIFDCGKISMDCWKNKTDWMGNWNTSGIEDEIHFDENTFKNEAFSNRDK